MKKTIDSMEENVNDGTLFIKELVYELENGASQGVYFDQISLSNLKHSQSGFQADMFTVPNKKIWLIDREGQWDKLRKDFDSVFMFRFELTTRKSMNITTGCFRFISTSGKNVSAEVVVNGIYDVCLENSVLRLSESQVLYRGQPIQDGCYKSVAFQAKHRFYCEDGELYYEYDGRCFDADINTMQRHDSPDTFPPFIPTEK